MLCGRRGQNGSNFQRPSVKNHYKHLEDFPSAFSFMALAAGDLLSSICHFAVRKSSNY
jgi:hypothetical protein